MTEAKGQLTELVRRAEAGDEIVLPRHGRATVRLVPVAPPRDAAARRSLIDAVRRAQPGRSLGRAGTAALIVVDTSAPTAILRDEPEAAACAAVLATGQALAISAGTVAEARIVADRRGLGREMRRLVDGLGFDVDLLRLRWPVTSPRPTRGGAEASARPG